MTPENTKRKVLAIDDSLMLLSFVKDILTNAGYQVATAATSAEGLKSAETGTPDLILLDYVLPGVKGDDLVRQFLENPATAKVPVVYMSGLGAELRPESASLTNVIGFLNKPFTSDLLIKSVESHMPKPAEQPEPEPKPEKRTPTEAEADASAPTSEPEAAPEPAAVAEPEPYMPAVSGTHEADFFAPGSTPLAPMPQPEPATAPSADEWWSAPQPAPDWSQPGAAPDLAAVAVAEIEPEDSELPTEEKTGGTFFCGDTRFFSLHWALQTVAKNSLTGTLRLFWHKEPVDLMAQNGQIVLVTTRDAALYCAETPITVANVDLTQLEASRAQQYETGTPMFLTLSQENLILREPAVQLVQHYGQKLFAHLWTAKRVRFVFENADVPGYARDLPGGGDMDNWALATLRTVQFQDLGANANYDVASIPAYTKDGFERIQDLRLTVAEAQFASQFNGMRSLAQIAKNLRLDLKFARVTLFRFIALEIVECWPPTAVAKPERTGIFQRLSRTIGIGD